MPQSVARPPILPAADPFPAHLQEESTVKITNVKIEKFSAPLSQPFRVAFGVIEDSDSWTVKVTTDEGIYGLGSAAPIGFVTGETMETCYTVMKLFADAFLGFDPLDIAGAHKLMDSIIYGNGSAKCAFDLALYDIAGKKQKPAGLPAPGRHGPGGPQRHHHRHRHPGQHGGRRPEVRLRKGL